MGSNLSFERISGKKPRKIRSIQTISCTNFIMHQYLQDTEFAAQNLFRFATGEDRELSSLADKLQSKERALKVHQWDFQTSDLNEDFSDAYVVDAFARSAKVAQEVKQLKSEFAVLQASVGTHQHSV